MKTHIWVIAKPQLDECIPKEDVVCVIGAERVGKIFEFISSRFMDY